MSTAVHWSVDGHATAPKNGKPLPPIVTGVGDPGAVGLNVTSCPTEQCGPHELDPTAVHWLVDGHATALSPLLMALSIVTGVGDPGAVGLNVTSRPLASIAVHWPADGHATPEA